MLVYDDYAPPDGIRRDFAGCPRQIPDKRIVVVFQPASLYAHTHAISM